MKRDDDVVHARHAEVVDYRLAKRRWSPATIFVARGVPHYPLGKVVSAAEIAAQRTDRDEPRRPAVRGLANRVRTGADDDAHTPMLRGAGAKDGKGVVVDRDRIAPALVADGASERDFFARDVNAGKVGRGVLRQPLAGRESRVERRLSYQRADDSHGFRQPEFLRVRSGAAHARQHGAVECHERDVGLAVSAVDGQDGDGRAAVVYAHGRYAAFSASSRSVSLRARSI